MILGCTMGVNQHGDLALELNPRGPALYFFRKLRKGEKRGARVPFQRALDRLPHEREVFTSFNELPSGPDFASRLRYSIEDFARGVSDAEDAKPFFSACSDALTAAEVKRACIGDPSIFRLMINPLDGERIISREWCFSFMGQVQHAIGTRLFWFGAIHWHPKMCRKESRHVHFLIRGRGLNGEVITFNLNFARYGFYTIATRMITEALGPMTEDEQARRVVEKKEMAEMRERMLLQRQIERMRRNGVPEWALESITPWRPSA